MGKIRKKRGGGGGGDERGHRFPPGSRLGMDVLSTGESEPLSPNKYSDLGDFGHPC